MTKLYPITYVYLWIGSFLLIFIELSNFVYPLAYCQFSLWAQFFRPRFFWWVCLKIQCLKWECWKCHVKGTVSQKLRYRLLYIIWKLFFILLTHAIKSKFYSRIFSQFTFKSNGALSTIPLKFSVNFEEFSWRRTFPLKIFVCICARRHFFLHIHFKVYVWSIFLYLCFHISIEVIM